MWAGRWHFFPLLKILFSNRTYLVVRRTAPFSPCGVDKFLYQPQYWKLAKLVPATSVLNKKLLGSLGPSEGGMSGAVVHFETRQLGTGDYCNSFTYISVWLSFLAKFPSLLKTEEQFLNCHMFHKVDVTAELETLLWNGGFVLAWPVQVAWEGWGLLEK